MNFSSLVKSSVLSVGFLAALGFQAQATQVGQVFVCYACQNTGNTAVDAALAANPGVASDGILFAFVNTSGSAITGGVFSVSNASPADTFVLPTIAAGSTFILIPGISNDGGSHTGGGLFAATGVKDTSDGDGGLSDASVFGFTGTDNSLAVVSTTAGTSTGTPGTFTPGDPGLIKPFVDNPANGSTSFVGLGPSGDGGCNNCYFGLVATLTTPSVVSSAPEPGAYPLMATGFGLAASWFGLRRRFKK